MGWDFRAGYGRPLLAAWLPANGPTVMRVSPEQPIHLVSTGFPAGHLGFEVPNKLAELALRAVRQARISALHAHVVLVPTSRVPVRAFR